MCPKLGFPSGSAVKNHKESDTSEQLSVHARVPNTVSAVLIPTVATLATRWRHTQERGHGYRGTGSAAGLDPRKGWWSTAWIINRSLSHFKIKFSVEQLGRDKGAQNEEP